MKFQKVFLRIVFRYRRRITSLFVPINVFFILMFLRHCFFQVPELNDCEQKKEAFNQYKAFSKVIKEYEDAKFKEWVDVSSLFVDNVMKKNILQVKFKAGIGEFTKFICHLVYWSYVYKITLIRYFFLRELNLYLKFFSSCIYRRW